MMSGLGFRGGASLTLSFFASSVSTAGLVFPASIQAGDVIFYGNFARNFSGSATPGTPVGYTAIINRDDLINGSSCWANVWYKIAAGTEGGTTGGGTNGGTENLRWAMVFRGDVPIGSINVIDLEYEQTDGDPADHTVTPGEAQLILAGYRSSGAVSTRGFSPAETAEISPSTLAYIKYALSNAGLATRTLSMGDDGNSNVLWGFGVQALAA